MIKIQNKIYVYNGYEGIFGSFMKNSHVKITCDERKCELQNMVFGNM